jgi:hypothetical protein
MTRVLLGRLQGRLRLLGRLRRRLRLLGRLRFQFRGRLRDGRRRGGLRPCVICCRVGGRLRVPPGAGWAAIGHTGPERGKRRERRGVAPHHLKQPDQLSRRLRVGGDGCPLLLPQVKVAASQSVQRRRFGIRRFVHATQYRGSRQNFSSAVARAANKTESPVLPLGWTRPLSSFSVNFIPETE